jgi:signal transduction histidine kinase
MSTLLFERSGRDRILAGVGGGVGPRLGVDPTLVRLVFALLTLAGGAGILLYLALWVYAGGRRAWPAIVLIAAATAALLVALGLSNSSVIGVTLLLAGLATVVSRGGSLRPGGSLPRLGVVLLIAGAVIFLGHSGGSTNAFIVPGAVVGALVLVVGPWVWQLTNERTERIRAEERAEVAARIHDSVLQTLALVQRHAAEPARVASLARRQERELRRWLYGSTVTTGTSLVDALSDAASEVEELHGVRIEIASAGDAALDESLDEVVLAAREAMTNAAKFAGGEISVFSEATPGGVAVFVRDRGPGFDRGAVAPDRRGLAESIEGRMRRIGGSAAVVSDAGVGTEVELRLARASLGSEPA